MSPRDAIDTSANAFALLAPSLRRPSLYLYGSWLHRAAFPRARRWLLSAIGSAALAVGVGCGGNSAPHGPPVLLGVFWEVNGDECPVWSPGDDGGMFGAVPPSPTQFNLVFDRVIDGSKIEDTVTINGVSRQQPKAMPPVSVSWPSPAMNPPSGPAFNLAVWYNSIHLATADVNTSYVYGRATPSYPSDASISITIDAMGITSEYNEPMVMLAPIVVQTQPFSVTLSPAPPDPANPHPSCKLATDTAGPGMVGTNYRLPLKFNNVPGGAVTDLAQHLDVRQGGRPLSLGEYQLSADPLDATRIFLQPGTIRIWDSGSDVTVTVAADVVDVYGSALGTAKMVTFTACEPVASDGGATMCGPPMGGAADGGAIDAGAGPDGGVDAPAD